MQKGRLGFTGQRQALRATIFTSILAVSFAVGMPAIAKKKPKEPEPCPVDNIIRTADPALLKRFAMLESCAPQLLVVPATPAEYEDPETAQIASNEATVQQGAYASDFFSGPQQRSEFSTHIASQTTQAATAGSNNDDQPAVYRYGKEFTKVPMAGTGRIVQIVPETNEVDYAPQGSAYSAAPPAGASEAEKILYMQPRSYRTAFDQLIANVALKHRVDPLLLHAVIKQESGYKNHAVSGAGARGLMQIMPGTGQSLGVATSNLHVAEVNVDAGARLLKKLWFKYGGDIDLTLAAYNAGEGAVAKYGNKIPPYRETQNYVRSIKAHYSRLLSEQGGAVR